MQNVESDGVGVLQQVWMEKQEPDWGLSLSFLCRVIYFCIALWGCSLSTQYFDICIEELYSFPSGCGKPEYYIFLNLKNISSTSK
jgi:hypothetical protein